MIRNSVITGDIHCNDYKPFSYITSEGYNSRFQKCLDTLEEMYSFAKEKKCERVFVLGDLFHNRSAIKIIIYDAVFRFFQNRTDIETFLIVGNHDQNTKDGSIHSLRPFKELTNVTVVDKPITIQNVFFYPYSEDSTPKIFIPADFFMGHIGVEGATIGASNFLFGENISPKLLKDYRECFIGHIHKHQQLGNIHIPGSPLQHTFGERDDKKGYLYVDKYYNVNFVSTKSPKFKLVEVSSESDIKGFSKNDYVQFVLKSKKVKNVDYKSLCPNCSIILDLPKKYEERLEIKSSENDFQILNNYVEKFSPYLQSQGFDVEMVRQIGNDILTQYEKRSSE